MRWGARIAALSVREMSCGQLLSLLETHTLYHIELYIYNTYIYIYFGIWMNLEE